MPLDTVCFSVPTSFCACAMLSGILRQQYACMVQIFRDTSRRSEACKKPSEQVY